jgi:hypothetical protein
MDPEKEGERAKAINLVRDAGFVEWYIRMYRWLECHNLGPVIV